MQCETTRSNNLIIMRISSLYTRSKFIASCSSFRTLHPQKKNNDWSGLFFLWYLKIHENNGIVPNVSDNHRDSDEHRLGHSQRLLRDEGRRHIADSIKRNGMRDSNKKLPDTHRKVQAGERQIKRRRRRSDNVESV